MPYLSNDIEAAGGFEANINRLNIAEKDFGK
jgi:hypothetical protein